jgi:hypothetical protein
VQQSSFHKEEETTWAAYMEGLPTGPWNPRLIYQGNLTCDAKGLASLMAVGQDHLHVIHLCSCCPCCSLSLCLSAIHFSVHGPPPLITVYCGQRALVSHSLLWTAWANKFIDTGPVFGLSTSLAPGRTAQIAPTTSEVTTTGQDQECRWTKRISTGLHQDKPCSSPHYRISILVSRKCYWTLSLHQFRFGCSMMLITARMWL